MKRSLFLSLCLFSQAVLAQLPIETWKTPNGVEVWFVSARHLPMVDIRLSFDAGSARDAELPGLALLTNGMMVEGTGSLDGLQVAEQVAQSGAILSQRATRDQSIFSLRSLSGEAYLAPVVDLLAQLLAKPAFPQKALERDSSSLLLNLEQRKTQIEAKWQEQMYQSLYHDHPYASPLEGTEESLNSIKRGDLQAFHQRYFVGNNAVLAVVGDLSLAQAKALAIRLTGALPSGAAAPALPAVPEPKSKTLRLEFDSTQSHLLLAQTVMARNDPDYYALYLGNHILGGSGFSSRLVKRIRQQAGLSYSVYSYFLPMRAAGPFMLALQTRNDQAAQAMALLRQELQDFIDQGPSDEELEHAKSNIRGGFARRVATNAQIISYLGLMGVYGLPKDYLDQYVARIEQVTAEQIRQAFQRRVDPDQMLDLIIGGDPDDG